MRLDRRLGRTRSILAGAAFFLLACPSLAQETSATGALERFQPSVAGDALFGVPSPGVGGHLVPRAKAVIDFGLSPLSVREGDVRHTIVSQQTFLHVNASFALWDRLLVSLDMPFALAQGGDSPTVIGAQFTSPQSAEVGDLRIGARVRLFGEDRGAFQVGLGGYLYTPTGPAGYAAEGAVRGEPHVVLGGRVDRFLYSVSVGTTLRASARPHTFDTRAGAAVVFGQDFFQIGPELSLSTPFAREVITDTPDTRITVASPVAAELLLGAKLRPLPFLVVGAGAGPGLTQGYGTPVFSAVGSIGYEPQAAPADKDTDGDDIPDKHDACRDTPGPSNEDPKKNGCPVDTDGDTIADKQDACPREPGPKNDDPRKNGCPPDTDNDFIVDPKDACPTESGPKNDDPKKNGCPPDTDNDSIRDVVDACPKDPGVANEDPKKNGCPPDRDADTVPDKTDACPDVPGKPDEEAALNGCPKVEVTHREIVIRRQIRFRFGQSSQYQTVDPMSDDLLHEVRDAILQHPEIELIEVQGHADAMGADEYNQILSQSRADSVRTWLIKRGIPPEKLVAKGYGASVPVDSNESKEGRQQNRRANFVIIKKREP
ncbi:OmpA family protein [Polyangium sp. 6x1]|uniref:OmpA family protein n=1 Tax=Polyangium sp. 6x1 TaxID=3042689 RepID=UPI002482AC38|nr:OmpA family protein [Polyangium sp. 6x1]MDI1447591.1 OmpA family protein [Polyangium sp. 6x1]